MVLTLCFAFISSLNLCIQAAEKVTDVVHQKESGIYSEL